MLVFQGTPSFVHSQNGKGTLPRRSLAMGSIPESHWKLPEGRGRGGGRGRTRWVGGDRSEMAAVGHGIVLTARGGIDSTDRCRRPGTSHVAVCGTGGGGR